MMIFMLFNYVTIIELVLLIYFGWEIRAVYMNMYVTVKLLLTSLWLL